MKLFENCLLACDIDGTLMINGEIPQANVEKIRFFTENGGNFALATGRSIGAVSSVTDKLDCISAGIFSNGGMIYDYGKDEVLFEAQVNKADYSVMYAVKEKFPEFGSEFHFGKNAGVYNRTAETDDHERYESLPSDIYRREQVDGFSINKIIYMLNKEEDIPIIREYISSLHNESVFIDTSATLYDRKRYYLEQVPVGISKSSGVLRLSSMLGIKQGNLFAIGDYFNDFDMLKIADISGAPSGSPNEIKDIATYVTTSAENGSVADFIDYLTKIRRK